MSGLFFLELVALLGVLMLAAYVDRVYSEMGKFLAREYQDNIDAWEKLVEPRLRMGRESLAQSATVLRQLSLAGVALLEGLKFSGHSGLLPFPSQVHLPEMLRTAFELVLIILVFDWLLPQMLFTRTKGEWAARITWLLQALFYLVLPVTLLLGLLLSIVALAEPEDAAAGEDSPEEAVDALLEAGEEEGILEESDRELVRSVVEFGDKVVRDVMTPRPEMFAVAGTLTLEEFTAELVEHSYSRVPVYAESLDHVTGIAFARDLLLVRDTDAKRQKVAEIQRAAAFVPEMKKVNELLREMQREKQHMQIVVDEYGGVAGLVTIEDLLEAIVGNIADEHDDTDEGPVREGNGTYVLEGGFEVGRLRELFAEELKAAEQSAEELPADGGTEAADVSWVPRVYEATTVGGLVSEIAGHIPMAGEVVEDETLRFEVLEATDRLVERVRVGLRPPQGDLKFEA